MELDLTGQLERRSAAPPVASVSSVEENGVDVTLELSLGWSSGNVGSGKRVREGDESVEEKKPKLEEGPVPYGIQVKPVILQRPNGYCNDHVMPCWFPSSEDVAESGINMPGINRNLAVESDGVIAGDFHLEDAAGDALLNSPESSNSETYVFQSFSDKGESSSTNESKNQSNSATTDNTWTISPAHTRGRKSPALSQKRRALVFTQSAEGNKIHGDLYECPKNEVKILCHCHGSFFSPAGFVVHAGGAETQHPLKQITVVAS